MILGPIKQGTKWTIRINRQLYTIYLSQTTAHIERISKRTLNTLETEAQEKRPSRKLKKRSEDFFVLTAI